MELIYDLTRKTWSNGTNEEIIRVVLKEKRERGKGREESKLPPECFPRTTVPGGKALAGP